MSEGESRRVCWSSEPPVVTKQRDVHRGNIRRLIPPAIQKLQRDRKFGGRNGYRNDSRASIARLCPLVLRWILRTVLPLVRSRWGGRLVEQEHGGALRHGSTPEARSKGGRVAAELRRDRVRRFARASGVLVRNSASWATNPHPQISGTGIKERPSGVSTGVHAPKIGESAWCLPTSLAGYHRWKL